MEGTDSEEEEEQDGSADKFGEDEPTLTRDDKEDVVFDMDTVESDGYPRIWLEWDIELGGG